MKMARFKDGEGIKSTLIIAEVQRRPVLYDANHQNYGERTLKMQNWEEVYAAVLPEWATMSVSERHASGKDIQKRWRSIRDSYTKAYRQGKCTPPGAVPPGGGRRSQHQRQMAFLYNALQRKIPRASSEKPSPDTEPPSPQGDATDAKLENSNEETQHKVEEWRLPSVDAAEDEKLEMKSALEAKSINEDMKTIIEANLQELKNVNEKIRKIDNASLEIKIDANTILPEDHFDDDKLFMNSLLPFFKKMDDDTRLTCRIEVLQIIKCALQAQQQQQQQGYSASRLEEVTVKEEAKSPHSMDDIKTVNSTASSLRMCRKRKATTPERSEPPPIRRRPGRPRKESSNYWIESLEREEEMMEAYLQRDRDRTERRRKREEARERDTLTQDEEEMYRATSVTQLKPPQFLKMYNLEPAKRTTPGATLPAPDANARKEILHTSPL